jgi:hypothetical protein
VPGSIGRRFGHPLVAVKASNRYKLLLALRQLRNAHSVYPFGEALHFADARPDVPAADVARELVASLRSQGFGDASAAPVVAGIEDVFMELMAQPGVRAA